MATQGRAATDILGQLALRGANILLGLVVTIVLVRHLGEEGFGTWATMLSIVVLAGYFADAGLDRVVVARAAPDPDAAAQWIGSYLALRATLSIVAGLIAAGVCLLVADSDTAALAGVLLSAQIWVSSASAARVAFQLQIRNAVPTAVELANGVLWGIAVMVIVFLDGGLVALAAAFLGVGTLTAVTTGVLALRAHPVVFTDARARWRPLMTAAIPIGIGGLLVLGYANLDQVIVYEIAGAREAGLYGAAYRIYERVHFVPMTLMVTLFPLIVAARDVDPARAARLVQVAFEWLLILSLPTVAISLAGPRDLATLLFGEPFAAAGPALPVLLATFVTVSVGFLAGSMVVAWDKQRVFVRIALLALVFNVVTNLLLVPPYGFMAAAWLTLATEVLVNALTLRVALRAAQMRLALGRVLRAAIAAALAGLASAAGAAAGAPVLVWLVGGGLVYVALLALLRVVRRADLVALMRKEVV